MSQIPVSIVPHFHANDEAGLAAFQALLPQFVEKTATEPGCLYYQFYINADTSEIFCREAYLDAEATLAHIQNVGALLDEAARHSTLIRLELHGPAAELEKLKGPLSDLNPAWFEYETGVEK